MLHRAGWRLVVLTTLATLTLVCVEVEPPHAFGSTRTPQAPGMTGGQLGRGVDADPPARRLATAPVTVPGNLTGLGFDACSAPSQSVMDTMRTTTPYWGVGVYIGGESRTCDQPNLTRSWVRTQHDKSWRIVPIWAGLQAPRVNGHGCSDRGFADRMSARNGRATSQGISAANRAVAHARELGIARGSTLFLDIESYENDLSPCNQPVQHFQSGWTSRLHRLGWKSGYYSSLKTGIYALDYVRTQFPGFYQMPDVVWFSVANGRANLAGSPYLDNRHWASQRMHQYRLHLQRTYAGETFDLDENMIAIGRGSVAGHPRGTCGVDLDFSHYRTLHRGDRSAQVAAAQCLLRRHALYRAALDGRFDRATAGAVGRWQDRVGIPVDRAINAATWASLLSAGGAPLVKRGSAGDRVRYLQRALTAALGKTVPVSGYFSPRTTDAAERYQRAVDLPRTGVVTRATWKALQHGLR